MQTDVTSQAQYINSLLSEAKTRAIGLRFIIDYLNQISHNIIQEKASHWLSIIIRACNAKEVGSYGELIYEALGMYTNLKQKAEGGVTDPVKYIYS